MLCWRNINSSDANCIRTKKYESFIGNYIQFPNRINVQFEKVLSRNEEEIIIWEGGTGFTLASGSSSC